MSLEQAIAALTAAVEANTAAILKGGSAPAAAPAPAPAAKAKAEPKGYEAKHTADEMKAVLTQVKETLGTPIAKAIIKDVGGVDKLAEITDPKVIDACYEAGKAKLKEAEDNM